MELLPPINQKIKDIIDKQFNGSVRAFCLKLGLSNSQKVNRLFNIDPRNNKYPIPSTEILTLISNKLGVAIGELIDNHLVVNEDPAKYGKEKSELRLLLEQNAQLVKNNTTLVETISKISEELINLHRESKNAHARGDVGCADVG